MEAIDIADWDPDEEYFRYPVGAREKAALYCPAPAPAPFLIPDHRYLFKYSVQWAPEQFWSEIAAYRIGTQIGVEVPPAHAAHDSTSEESGALIEWFYDHPGEDPIRYTAGGDHLSEIIEQFDRDRGTKHNFISITKLCRALRQRGRLEDDWLGYWSRVLAFDALIGNTDRHQDNWGFLWREQHKREPPIATFSPAFDNGTSLGYEKPAAQLPAFASPEHTERYVRRGRHHMRWTLKDAERLNHRDFLVKLGHAYPEARTHMLNCLDAVTPEQLEQVVEDLTGIATYQPLMPERAEFMARILRFRHSWLLTALG